MSTKLTGPVLNNSKATGSREWFSLMPIQADPDYVILRDDFLAVAATTSCPIPWTVVKDSGASVAVTADQGNGILNLTSTATTDNDGSSIQSTDENILPEAGKKIWIESKLKLANVADGEMLFGLVENFATNPEACLSSPSCIGFVLAEDGAGALNAKTWTASGTDSTAATTLVANTYVKLGILVDGVSSVKYFVDRSLVATHNTAAKIPNTELCIALYELSGTDAGTQVMSVDYVTLVKNR